MFLHVFRDEEKDDREEQNEGHADIDEARGIDAPVNCVEFVDENREGGMIENAVISGKKDQHDDQLFQFGFHFCLLS